MRKSLVATLTLTALLVTGCTSHEVYTTKPALPPLSMSASTFQPFKLSDYARLQFEPVIPQKTDKLLTTPNRYQVYQSLQKLIAQALLHKLNGHDQQTTLVVRYALASDTIVTDEQLVAFFGSTPGLVLGDEQNKFTLAIALINQETGAILWKGAAQAVSLQDLTEEQQLQRAQQAIEGLFKSIH